MENRKKARTGQENHRTVPVIGLYEKALPAKYTWEQKLSQTSAAGYDFMEISIDESEDRISRLEWSRSRRRDLLLKSQDLNTPIRSLSLSTHRRFPIGSLDNKTRDTGMDYLEKAITFSLEMGIRTILLSGCDVYYEKSTPRTRKLFLENLSRAIHWAEQAQVMLALENWDKSIDSLTAVMQYVNHFQSPWFQAYADIGNLVYAGKDVLSELETARGHIAALHVKDTLPGKLRFVAPGEGCVPFLEAFQKLAGMDYHGPIVLELWTGDQPDAVEQIRRSYNWVVEKLITAGFTGSMCTSQE